ncbi:hypothetical protein CEUSTIGMA_g7939.t1 [Chlamydomonas eustigma]|uniref:BolA protein n=1 Tax=Chlamydomonas eustigma TaxID=1157962 RepID=A0A250XBP0_9CHLO|nr:hypothetical protein CEUSTIGMA_g7939.t1 [Chlamydomonas eustigma]|eukprot:GAX80501.1 hypothetical protein CEUSTIGMA_g7939.t1 [Chlamydomonas eustigma]
MVGKKKLEYAGSVESSNYFSGKNLPLIRSEIRSLSFLLKYINSIYFTTTKFMQISARMQFSANKQWLKSGTGSCTYARNCQPTLITLPHQSPSTRAASSSGSNAMQTPDVVCNIQERVKSKLLIALNPVRLVVEDESPTPKLSRQAIKVAEGAAGVAAAASQAAPAPREVHLRVEIVSRDFEGLSLIKRQRRVNELLKEEFDAGLHALSLETRSPQELIQQQ